MASNHPTCTPSLGQKQRAPGFTEDVLKQTVIQEGASPLNLGFPSQQIVKAHIHGLLGVTAILLQNFVPRAIGKSKDGRFEVLTKKSRFGIAKELPFLDRIRRDGQDVPASEEHGPGDFAIDGFRECHNTPIEGN